MSIIRILAVPKFEVTVDLKLVEALIVLSEAHYDAVCRSYSVTGGLLLNWRGQFFWQDTPPATVEVSATFRDLDIITKICEMRSWWQPGYEEGLVPFLNSVRQALTKSYEVCNIEVKIE